MKTIILLIGLIFNTNTNAQSQKHSKDFFIDYFNELIKCEEEGVAHLLTGEAKLGYQGEHLYLTAKPFFSDSPTLEVSKVNGQTFLFEDQISLESFAEYKVVLKNMIDAGNEVFIPFGCSFEKDKPVKTKFRKAKKTKRKLKFKKPGMGFVIKTVENKYADKFEISIEYTGPCNKELPEQISLKEANDICFKYIHEDHLFFYPGAPEGTVDYIKCYNTGYAHYRLSLDGLKIEVENAKGKYGRNSLDNTGRVDLFPSKVELMATNEKIIKSSEITDSMHFQFFYEVNSEHQQLKVHDFLRTLTDSITIKGSNFNEEKVLTFNEQCKRFTRGLMRTEGFVFLKDGFNDKDKSRVNWIDIKTPHSDLYVIVITEDRRCSVSMEISEWKAIADKIATTSFSGELDQLKNIDFPSFLSNYGIVSTGINLASSEYFGKTGEYYYLDPVITSPCTKQGKLYYLFFTIE